jgi:hypothetical protein
VTDLEGTRARVIELLRHEGCAMHTGEIAVRIGVPTHLVHTCMHVPLQRFEVGFSSSEGYFLIAQEYRTAVDNGTQPRLA